MDMTDAGKIEEIVADIFGLGVDSSRRDGLKNFLTTTINGDAHVQGHLAISAVLDDERGLGVLVYILTDVRIIKVEVDAKNVKALTPTIASITNFRWELLDGNRNSVAIYFQGGEVFGLTYQADTALITEFFQKVDLARNTKK